MFRGKWKYLADHLSSGFEILDEEFWRKELKWQVRSKLSWNVQPDLNSARPIITKEIAFWIEPANFWTFIMFEIWVVPFWGRSQCHVSPCPLTAKGYIQHSGFIPRMGFPRRVLRLTYRLEPNDITFTIEEKKTDRATSNLQHANLQMDFMVLPI